MRLLTVASGARRALAGHPLGSDPAWSPKGRLLALATPRGIACELRAAPLSSSGEPRS